MALVKILAVLAATAAHPATGCSGRLRRSQFPNADTEESSGSEDLEAVAAAAHQFSPRLDPDRKAGDEFKPPDRKAGDEFKPQFDGATSVICHEIQTPLVPEEEAPEMPLRSVIAVVGPGGEWCSSIELEVGFVKMSF